MTRGETVKVWPVPACLEIKLLIAKTAVAGGSADEKDADVVVPLTVSDPDNVRLVGILLPTRARSRCIRSAMPMLSDNAVDRWSTAFDAIQRARDPGESHRRRALQHLALTVRRIR